MTSDEASSTLPVPSAQQLRQSTAVIEAVRAAIQAQGGWLGFEQYLRIVLYAPGLQQPKELRELIAALELPVNVLARPGAPTVAELTSLGVKRVSVGGAFAFAAFGALTSAANELLHDGTYGFLELAGTGFKEVRAAFTN